MVRMVLFLTMALGLLGFGAVAWVSAHPPTGGAHKQPSPEVALLSVAHDVQAGTLLKAEDLDTKKFLAAAVPTGATPDSPDARRALVGGMVRHALSAGDVIMPADVMRPGDHGFLAAVLQPGMRAVTVGVDEVSGTAGLIWPGDRVDVIMTQLIDDPSVPLGRRISAEAVLHGARVIAIDQELVQGASPGSASREMARTVTLEVTEMQAERVQVATRIGELSLAVCSAQRGSPQPAPGATTVWAEDVSHAIAQVQVVKPDAPPSMMHVFQGAMDEVDYRF
jgi:pilus assembly protein CpaB